MGKLVVFVILAIVIVGLFYYFKPSETKETFVNGKDMVGSIVKDKWDSREQNLGQPTTPCETNEDCNLIEDCQNLCDCFESNCYKNFKLRGY